MNVNITVVATKTFTAGLLRVWFRSDAMEMRAGKALD